MKTRKLAVCVAALAAFGMATRTRGAGTNQGLTTNFYLYTGSPRTDVAELPRVLLFPGTVIVPTEGGSDFYKLYEQIEHAYRLDELKEAASKTVALELNKEVVVPSATKNLTTAVTLLFFDDAQTAYRIRLQEGEKVLSDAKIAVERGKRGVIGGRDGNEAPYFFLIVRPDTVEEEQEYASIKDLTPPVLVQRVHPEYPESARAAKVQGAVVVKLTVVADGSVRDAQVEQGPQELREATLKAVNQFRFKPAHDKHGRAVEFPYHVSVWFTLEPDEAPKRP